MSRGCRPAPAMTCGESGLSAAGITPACLRYFAGFCQVRWLRSWPRRLRPCSDWPPSHKGTRQRSDFNKRAGLDALGGYVGGALLHLPPAWVSPASPRQARQRQAYPARKPVFRAVALGGKVSAGPLADDSASRIVKGYAIECRSRFPLPMPAIAYRPNSDIRRRRPMPVSETNSIALLSVGPAALRPYWSFSRSASVPNSGRCSSRPLG
jgi:hypothetical protein